MIRPRDCRTCRGGRAFARRLVAASLTALAVAPAIAGAVLPNQLPRYYPRTPTTSPYLGLLSNGGDLNNYYSIVRPLQRQAEINRTQQLYLEAQDDELRRVQTQVNEAAPGAVRPTGRNAWFGTHRQDGQFDNRLNYYYLWDARRPPRTPRSAGPPRR